MKAWRRKLAAGSAGLVLASVLLWQFAPVDAVLAVASLSDPVKLAALGERGANPRLNKIVYWLDHARRRGLPPGITLGLAQRVNRTTEPRASLVREALLRNLQIADRLGLLTADNRDRLRHGRAAIVTRGPYTGSPMEVDHIVPYSLAPEAGNELANLEMLPQALNRRKSNRVGDRQVAHARRLAHAGLISQESLARVEARRPAATYAR